MKVDCLVVGAGFAGCTVAERLASQFNKQVLVVDKRNHIGGNAYDCFNEDGILIQKYGPHIFHTNSKKVWEYISQFTEWNNYVHRVIALVNGEEYYLPINLDTMEKLCRRSFDQKSLEEYFDKHRLKLDKVHNSRDVVVSQVGEEIYNLFFKNYTRKQWGVYPEELDAQVTRRLPVRFNRDTRYFSDSYQGIPKHGFTRMFENMLENNNIRILLNTDYKDIVDSIKYEKMVYTGPIDYYFDNKFGKLPYRSLMFTFETKDVEKYQNAAVVNYPNDHEYTRITEFKQFYLQDHKKTTICYEFPCAEGDPYYPIPVAGESTVYQKYKAEADKLKNTLFLGRLGEYRYLNMDKVVEIALEEVNAFVE